MTKKKKTETQQNQSFTNTFGQIAPTETPDTAAVRNWKPQADPGIGYAFGRALRNIKNTFENPLGADTPQSVRDATLRSAEGELGQQEAQARAEEAYRNAGMDLSRLMYLDERTSPRIVQTGGNSAGSSTTVQRDPFQWGQFGLSAITAF